MGKTSFRKNNFWIPVRKNKVDVANHKSQKSITTFSKALRATLIIGQVFSLLPFVGVFSNVASNVKFVKTSWKCAYSLLSFLGQMFMTVLCINKLSSSKISLNGTSTIIFYITTCVTMMLFFQMARRWPQLVQHIAKVEDLDPNFDSSLTRKCNITCAVVLILAMQNKVSVANHKFQKSITTFSEALRATLIIGQVFSLLPFIGVFSNVASNVKFVKTSWKCVYSLLSLFGHMFMTMLCINQLSNSNVSLGSTSTIIFYITTCVTMMLFFQMARRWPQLVQHIAEVEDLDPNFDCSLTRKCNITCAVVLILAILEHMLSLVSGFAGAAACDSKLETYEGFVKHFYPWIFDYLSFSLVLGVITQFLHLQSAFIWNFSDLFVICMSYYLTSRLDQVNKKLLAAQGKYLPEIFWRGTREDYCRATKIVRKVDDVISGVVLISFANNLFFICLQLFNTLEDGLKGTEECNNGEKKILVSKSGPLGGYEAATYFLFSLVYLLSRSVAVCLIASQVNSASAVPAPVLYDVPSPVYCVEVQRFLDQVNGDKVALSGLQFFLVTRGLLLTVAGTIVTYELVMLQFKTPTPTLNITSPDSTLTTLAF